MVTPCTWTRAYSMRPTKKLSNLHVSARRRLMRLRFIVLNVRTGTGRDDCEARIAFVTIEMLNLWRNFIRSYYLSCVYTASTSSGVRITMRHLRQTENQAIGFAVKRWRPRSTSRADGSWRSRDEPTWHDPNQVIPIMQDQGLSNLADFEAALSTGDRTFIDLPVFRNYFGHRNGRSQAAAQNLAPLYGIPNYQTAN